eukprot:3241984-Pyramimonas_sp.AAC.1
MRGVYAAEETRLETPGEEVVQRGVLHVVDINLQGVPVLPEAAHFRAVLQVGGSCRGPLLQRAAA